MSRAVRQPGRVFARAAVVAAALIVCACERRDDASHAGLNTGASGASGALGDARSAFRDDAGLTQDARRSNDASAGDRQEPLEVLVEGEDAPRRIAIDDRYVYWTTAHALRRAPLSGGTAVTLASGSELQHLAVESGSVFFTDSTAGTALRVDREGSMPEVLGTGTTPAGIAALDGIAYWANTGTTAGPEGDGTIATAPLQGSSPALLADRLVSPSAIALDREFVYFSSTSRGCGASSPGMSSQGAPPPGAASCWGGGVWKLARAGGDPQPIDTQDTPLDVVVGERGVYWMIAYPPRVMFAPRDGATPYVLADALGEDVGPLALDAEALYFSASGKGRVLTVPLKGGTPRRLVTDLGTTGGIAVDDRWVYVAATSQGKIVRVAKDGTASEPSGPIAGPCPTPLGSAREIALTPRPEPNLELLALALDDGAIVATQATYDRVVADVAAIRKLAPELAHLAYFPAHDGRTLLLRPSDLTFRSIELGQYSAWNCLNDFYGVESIEPQPSTILFPWVQLVLKGIYNLDALAGLYAQLPGMEHADPNGFGGDNAKLCAFRNGSNIEYVLDRAGGDCLAGCTEHEAHRFRSRASADIETLDTWNSASGTPAPQWFTQACTRR